jgi:hypothetical protein
MESGFENYLKRERKMNFQQEVLFHTAIRYNLTTDDPVVNWKVDNYFTNSCVPYDKELYSHEIEAWKKCGGKVLSITFK